MPKTYISKFSTIVFKNFIVLCFQLFLLNLSTNLNAQEHHYRFQHISINDGLSQSTVQCMLQDSKGFLWFGTDDGLNRYDGYKFEIYRHDPEIPNSLSDNSIWAIFEDSYGELWIGTLNGLNKFDREKNQFIRYQNDPQNLESLSDNIIWSIYEDSSRNLWIGTDNGGLNLFNRQKGSFINYKHDADNEFSLISNSVISILEDKTGNFWVGTFSGLNRFDREQGKFYHYVSDPDNPNSLKNNEIVSIYEDRSGTLWFGTGEGLHSFNRERNQFIRYPFASNLQRKLTIQTIFEDHLGSLWVGTDVGGLFKFNKEKGSFVHYTSNPDDPNSLSNNEVWSIYEDHSDVLWIGTGLGLSKLNLGAKNFVHYQYRYKGQNCLSDNVVWSVVIDQLGYLWIGTDTGGLNKYDRKKNEFTVYKNNPNDPKSIGNNCVLSICEDRRGAIWIGTYGGGLNKFNRANETFFKFKHDPKDSNSLSSNFVQSIYEDDSGVLWIGTEQGVLNKFDRLKKTFTRYPLNKQGSDNSSTNEIWTIHEDRSGYLWIGTERGGLIKFDPKSETISYFQNDVNYSNSVSSNSILSIYEDKFGTFWLGTGGGGLNKFDPIAEKFTHYRKKDGLPNDVVYGILVESNSADCLLGNFWLSTNKGLSKFNPITRTFRNYDVWDGLQSNEFNSGAYFKNKSGEMFFGGINGLTSFFPDNIKDNSFKPPIVFTDFKLFYKSLPIGSSGDGRSILKKSITETECIELTHNENIFSIEFSALNFAVPEKNLYKYKMEGMDRDWNILGTSNVVSFYQLPAGDYKLRVKGSNCDGIWNEDGALLKIKITPPFWKTLWFRFFAGVIFISLLFAGYKFKTYNIKERNKQLEEINAKLNKQIADRKRAEKALRESEAKVRLVIQNMPVMLNAFDADGNIVIWNHECERVTGYSANEIVNNHRAMELLYPDRTYRDQMKTEWANQGDDYRSWECEIGCKDGSIKTIAWSDISGQFSIPGWEIWGIGVDVTERKQAEEQVQKDLKEKVVLLKEIHHRVKNNLQVVSSLLYLQSKNLKNKQALNIIHESQNRVHAMAMVHEKLYQSKSLAKIDFSEYIKDLTRFLYRSYAVDINNIKLTMNIQNVPLDVDSSIPCGLILNELVSNAIKYAFPGEGKGEILVEFLSEQDNNFKLIVKDNGIGLPKDIQLENSKSLGLRLIKNLVDQLEGKMEIETDEGTTFRISFSLNKNKRNFSRA